jgi:hypothetical protein
MSERCKLMELKVIINTSRLLKVWEEELREAKIMKSFSYNVSVERVTAWQTIMTTEIEV